MDNVSYRPTTQWKRDPVFTFRLISYNILKMPIHTNFLIPKYVTSDQKSKDLNYKSKHFHV